jgi:uncharacterized iron-regulated membrane protein
MKLLKIRKFITKIHRYLGLFVGIVVIIVGLTGSLLVFRYEIDAWDIQHRFGASIEKSIPQSPEILINNVKSVYAVGVGEAFASAKASPLENRPDWKIAKLIAFHGQDFYTVRIDRPDDKQQEVFINPYTGKIIGDRQRQDAIWGRILSLHYQLLSGDVGTIIAGIAALLLLVLSITGIILWSGWRKLWLGFKISWRAHPIRVNYDLHKVAGIVTAIFLGATAFTGFCWNFSDVTYPLIYTLTQTTEAPEVESTILANKPTLDLDDIVNRSNLALPGAITTAITFPQQPTDVFEISKRFPQDLDDFSSYVKLDRYSGKILQVRDSRTAKLADRILNSFVPLHYGTFGGLPTRILYIFVGIAPLILFITGSKMFTLRNWSKAKQKEVKQLAIAAQVEHPESN